MSENRAQVPAVWFVILVVIAALEGSVIVFLGDYYVRHPVKMRSLEVFIYGWCTDQFDGDPVENATIMAFLGWESDWKYTSPSRATSSWQNGFYVLSFRIYEDVTNEDFEILASHEEAYAVDSIRIYHLKDLYEIGWGSIVWRQDFNFVTTEYEVLDAGNANNANDDNAIHLNLLGTISVGVYSLEFHGFVGTGDTDWERRYNLAFGVWKYDDYAGEMYVPLALGQTFTIDYDRAETTPEGDTFVYLAEAKLEIFAFNVTETWVELRRIGT